jgi:hypothetical protein
MKYPQMFYVFSALNFVVPYATGPILVLNSKRMEEWGWLPLEVDDEKHGFSENEIRILN